MHFPTALCIFHALLLLMPLAAAFVIQANDNCCSVSEVILSQRSTFVTPRSTAAGSATRLFIQRGTPGRSAPRGKTDKSKRQYRVGELVRTELARIIQSGLIKGKDASPLEDGIRSRISIVSVDVSPDLRQARVSVSIRNGNGSKKKTPSVGDEGGDESKDFSGSDATVDKRRAYSWLVENTKAIRHTLAQRMSHLKTSPSLTFVQVDVAAAVDVMYLIDKVSKGYERESIGEYGGNNDNLPLGFVEDDEEDDFEWEEEDDDFFNS